MLANISYYQNNQEIFQQHYGGRYLLIIEQHLLGDFSSWSEACAQGFGLLQHDNFLVKYCA